jgi:hypothetical protein
MIGGKFIALPSLRLIAAWTTPTVMLTLLDVKDVEIDESSVKACRVREPSIGYSNRARFRGHWSLVDQRSPVMPNSIGAIVKKALSFSSLRL